MAKLLRFVYCALLAIVFALMLSSASAAPNKNKKEQHDQKQDSKHQQPQQQHQSEHPQQPQPENSQQKPHQKDQEHHEKPQEEEDPGIEISSVSFYFIFHQRIPLMQVYLHAGRAVRFYVLERIFTIESRKVKTDQQLFYLDLRTGFM